MKLRWMHEAAKLALFVYAAALLRLTVMPSSEVHASTGHSHLNCSLVPFRTISELINHLFTGEVGLITILYNVFGNIALFIPLGLLAPAIWPRLRVLWRCLLLGALVSVGIELAQLTFSLLGMMYRTVDIDDVILNTIGAAGGYGIYYVFSRIFCYQR